MSTLVIGAVAYDPKVVTIWEGFKAWFNQRGQPFDYVLFSTYEAQVEAQGLERSKAQDDVGESEDEPGRLRPPFVQWGGAADIAPSFAPGFWTGGASVSIGVPG